MDSRSPYLGYWDTRLYQLRDCHSTFRATSRNSMLTDRPHGDAASPHILAAKMMPITAIQATFTMADGHPSR